MRLHELDYDKIDPNLSKAIQKKTQTNQTGPNDELDAGADSKNQRPIAQQPGAGTGPNMQMPRSQIKVTPITMKNYQGGMARSMSGV